MPDCALASRHLGLITAAEVEGLQEKILRLAGQMEESVDLDALFAIAASAPPLTASLETARPRSGGGIPIAVARDRAFSFYYEDNLELLEELGAELVEFSPLTSRHLPSGAKGLYLGGGYPETVCPAAEPEQGSAGGDLCGSPRRDASAGGVRRFSLSPGRAGG